MQLEIATSISKKNRVKLEISPKEKEHYKASHPEIGHKIIYKYGFVYLQETDTVQSRMDYSRRWKGEKERKIQKAIKAILNSYIEYKYRLKASAKPSGR